MSTRHLLVQRRFAPFFVTQFLGAFNDNLFKNLLVLLVTFNTVRFTHISPGVLSNIAAAVFILPFVLFSATAGYLADQMDKARLMRIIKSAEVIIMLLAGIGFALSSLGILLVSLFLMGTHSAFFGPVKYSILPQVLNEDELVKGNAWVEMGTFVAILLGTLAAGYLLSITDHPLMISFTLLAVAIAGLLASWKIPSTAPASLAPLSVSFSDFRSSNQKLLATAREKHSVWLSILAISWFWLLGSVLLAQLPALVKDVLHADASAVTGLLAVFSISVGLGSLLCSQLSGDHVEIGVVPIGSLGISIFCIDVWWACHTHSTLPAVTETIWHNPLYQRMAADLALIGIFSGLFIVPLYSFVQLRTPKDKTSRVIAANNIINALFMVGGAGVAAGLLISGFDSHEIVLLAGMLNIVVAIYIYTVVPEFLWRFIVWVLIHTIYRIEKQGLEHIPKQGPAVLICNHISFADAIIIAGAVRRPIRFVMDYQIFKHPMMSWIFKLSRAIPIAPQKADALVYETAFEQVRLQLADDELVCIFPEGKITNSGEMNEFKKGIVRIIDETPQACVIPMALSGLWGSVFSRKETLLVQRLRSMEWVRTVRLNVGAAETGDTRKQPDTLRDIVLQLRGNWL